MDPELEIALAQRTAIRALGALVAIVIVLGVFAVGLIILTPDQSAAATTVGLIAAAGQAMGILAIVHAVLAARRLGDGAVRLADAARPLDRFAQALRNIAIATPAVVILTAALAVLVATRDSDDSAVLIAALTAALTAVEPVAGFFMVRTRVLRRRDRIVTIAKVA